MFQRFIPKIHKEGYSFVLIFVLTTLICFYFSSKLGMVGLILSIWCVYFFRNPDRVTPKEENLVISPADGYVCKIEEAEMPPELEMDGKKALRVSVFLSVFDVHVNRVPAFGTITKLVYFPGKFFNACLDKASIHNERQTILMKTKFNQDLVFTQIAGLVARRIVCYLEEGQEVRAGERFGIIRFGSRMDIYLPEGVNPQVVEGQLMIGGETIIADLKSSKARQEGEIR